MLSVLLLLSAGSPDPATGEDMFARLVPAAIRCADDFAARASFNRKRIDLIPGEMLDSCRAERTVAVQDLRTALSGRDAAPTDRPEIVENYVDARMRRTAQARLIERLEAGERLPADTEPGFSAWEAGARYVFCLRLAITHHLEGIYFGKDWRADVAGKTQEQLYDYFLALGRPRCQASMRAHAQAFLESFRPEDRQKGGANWTVTYMERTVAKDYVEEITGNRTAPPR